MIQTFTGRMSWLTAVSESLSWSDYRTCSQWNRVIYSRGFQDGRVGSLLFTHFLGQTPIIHFSSLMTV